MLCAIYCNQDGQARAFWSREQLTLYYLHEWMSSGEHISVFLSMLEPLCPYIPMIPLHTTLISFEYISSKWWGSSLGNIFVMGIGIQLEVKWSYAWSCFIILLIIFGVSWWILIWFTPGTPCFMRDTSWFMASFLQSLATKLLVISSKAKSVMYCFDSGAPIA